MTPIQRIEKAKTKIEELKEAMLIGDRLEAELLCEYLESAFSKLRKIVQLKQLKADIFDRLQQQNKITFNSKEAKQ